MSKTDWLTQELDGLKEQGLYNRIRTIGSAQGARLVVDWEARSPEWAALTLLHTEGRCRLGHVMRAGAQWLFAPRLDGTPTVVPQGSRVLGTIVAGVTAL